MNKLNQILTDVHIDISKGQEEWVKEFLENIINGDPIKKKWVKEFFKIKSKNLDSNMSLDQFCKIMERDDRLDDLIN